MPVDRLLLSFDRAEIEFKIAVYRARLPRKRLRRSEVVLILPGLNGRGDDHAVKGIASRGLIRAEPVYDDFVRRLDSVVVVRDLQFAAE